MVLGLSHEKWQKSFVKARKMEVERVVQILQIGLHDVRGSLIE